MLTEFGALQLCGLCVWCVESFVLSRVVDWGEKGEETAGEVEKYEAARARIYDVPRRACPAKKAVNGWWWRSGRSIPVHNGADRGEHELGEQSGGSILSEIILCKSTA